MLLYPNFLQHLWDRMKVLKLTPLHGVVSPFEVARENSIIIAGMVRRNLEYCLPTGLRDNNT